MNLATMLFLTGLGLYGYSMTFEPYANGHDLDFETVGVGDGDSEAYWTYRDKMLTPKYRLEDYAITCIGMAVAVFLVFRNGHFSARVPRSRGWLILLAFSLPVISVQAFTYDIRLGFDRDEFPPWADTVDIPLMGTPIMFFFYLLISLMHLVFLPTRYPSDTSLTWDVFRTSNRWLLGLSCVLGLLTLDELRLGAYWYGFSTAIWVYFFASLAVARRKGQMDWQNQSGRTNFNRPDIGLPPPPFV